MRGRRRFLAQFSPAAHALGFTPLPAAFFGFLVGMIITYLILIEVGKRPFYRRLPERRPPTRLVRSHTAGPSPHVRWTVIGGLRPPSHPEDYRQGIHQILAPVEHPDLARVTRQRAAKGQT